MNDNGKLGLSNLILAELERNERSVASLKTKYCVLLRDILSKMALKLNRQVIQFRF